MYLAAVRCQLSDLKDGPSELAADAADVVDTIDVLLFAAEWVAGSATELKRQLLSALGIGQ
jgi:hypothetical protein